MQTLLNQADRKKREDSSIWVSLLLGFPPLIGAVVLQVLLNRLMGREHMFLLLVPSLLIAWYRGFKDALFCLPFSMFAVIFFVFSPALSPRLDNIYDLIGIAAFYALVAGVAWAVSSLAERTSELRQTVQTLETVVSGLADGVIFTDGHGGNPRMNPAALLLLGFEKHEDVFASLEEFDKIFVLTDTNGKEIAPEDGPVHLILRGERVRNLDVTVRRTDTGHTARASYSGSAVRDRDGNIKLVILLMRDISKQALVESELRRAREEAERASLMKTSFLANMSHEIRTPMTAVLGFAEVLREPALSDTEKRDALDRIERSGRALLSLIDDILDIAKVESGKMELNPGVFSPQGLASEVLSILSNQARQRGLAMKLETGDAVPEKFASDPARVRQIMMNLVGNAIKFTKSGQVTVQLALEDRQLVIRVEDTGIGLSPEEANRLFQPFSQSDSSINRRFGGTGLGLFLSRQIAETLGGTLTLESSQKGVGSRFSARIPSFPGKHHGVGQEPSQTPAPTHEMKPLGGLSVLVAEDVPDSRDLLHVYLAYLGIRNADFAANGEEALLKASRRGYDVILMDIQMPGLDGLEATRRLRQLGYTKPIVALTAHAMPGEVEDMLRQGFDGHLAKPLNKNDLAETLSRFTARPAGRAKNPASGRL